MRLVAFVLALTACGPSVWVKDVRQKADGSILVTSCDKSRNNVNPCWVHPVEVVP